MAQPAEFNRRISRSAYLDHLRSQRVARSEIASILLDASDEAQQMAARLLPDAGVGQDIRRAQLNVLTRELRNQQEEIWRGVQRTMTRGVRDASAAAVEGQATLAEYLTRAGAPPQLQNQFIMAARGSAENVRSKLLNDIDLSPAVYRNQQRVIDQVNRQVSRGIAQNLSAREMADGVKRFVSPNVRGGVDYAAMRLARTEINNAFHATSVRSYADSPFVEAVKWELSASHPRPDDCDDLAETDDDRLGVGVYRPQNVPFKPHPQCLCYTTTVTPSRDKFLDNLMSGSYDGWLRSQGMTGMVA